MSYASYACPPPLPANSPKKALTSHSEAGKESWKASALLLLCVLAAVVLSPSHTHFRLFHSALPFCTALHFISGIHLA